MMLTMTRTATVDRSTTMSNHIPTTAQVRTDYVRANDAWGQDFDSWLASVKADAWYEGWSAADDYGLADEDTDNPYRGESE